MGTIRRTIPQAGCVCAQTGRLNGRDGKIRRTILPFGGAIVYSSYNRKRLRGRPPKVAWLKLMDGPVPGGATAGGTRAFAFAAAGRDCGYSGPSPFRLLASTALPVPEPRTARRMPEALVVSRHAADRACPDSSL